MACKYAERVTRTNDICAPEFCLQGFKEVRSGTAKKACGSSNGDGCLQAEILKPLLERKTMVEDEFASYAQRNLCVKACLDIGKCPLYIFHQISQEDLDTRAKYRQQDTLWNVCLAAKI
jgi:hypothetical protein